MREPILGLLQPVVEVPLGVVAGKCIQWLTALAVPILGLVAVFDLTGELPKSSQELVQTIKSNWLLTAIVVVATVLVTCNPGQRLAQWAEGIRDDNARSSHLQVALEVLRTKLPKIRYTDGRYVAVWEGLLRAAQAEVEEKLRIGPSCSLKVNLLLLDDKDHATVVARSKPGSPINVQYALKADWPATHAIRMNRTNVRLHINRKMQNHRPYKSVAATPVAVDDRMFGALTVDSTAGGTFRGKTELIDGILRPYAALVAITLPQERFTLSCERLWSR